MLCVIIFETPRQKKKRFFFLGLQCDLLLEADAAAHGVLGIVFEDAARGVDGQVDAQGAVKQRVEEKKRK